MSEPISTIVGGTRHELLSMPWDEYLAFPALNSSVIVDGHLQSMLQLQYVWEHGIPDTDLMQFGRMVHCLLLEPSEFESRYRSWEGRRQGNAYKDFYAEAVLAGAEVVRAEGTYSLASALEASQSFLRDGRVQKLISAGQAEQTVLATECGLQCKSRLDWVSTSEHVLTDLKTTGRIERRAFGQIFHAKCYDLKLGLYRRWLNSVTNDCWPVEVIVLENKPPYDIAVRTVPDATLDRGVDLAMKVIEKVRQAIDTGVWPGVTGGEPEPLEVPNWAMAEALTGYEEYQG